MVTPRSVGGSLEVLEGVDDVQVRAVEARGEDAVEVRALAAEEHGLPLGLPVPSQSGFSSSIQEGVLWSQPMFQ